MLLLIPICLVVMTFVLHTSNPKSFYLPWESGKKKEIICPKLASNLGVNETILGVKYYVIAIVQLKLDDFIPVSYFLFLILNTLTQLNLFFKAENKMHLLAHLINIIFSLYST